ncbi:MAG: PstC family ABC transporter permease [Kiritimatiellia bacterium]
MMSSDRTLEMPSLMMTSRANGRRHFMKLLGESFLFGVTFVSAAGILFIIAFIFKDSLPYFRMHGLGSFFHSDSWRPTGDPASFGALGIFVGTALVTIGSCLLAVPLGVAAAICLSDVISFEVRQVVKPVIELLAAIPSVAYGFFALVVFAPLLQREGGHILAVGLWAVAGPLILIAVFVAGDLFTPRVRGAAKSFARWAVTAVLGALAFWGMSLLSQRVNAIKIASGVNALNASIWLAVMAVPTVVSVCEDALTAVGRDMRAGSYALGATRAETVLRVIMPAASGGIVAAVLLGVMRAVGETMLVLMAAGNAFEVPDPWYNLITPVRTLTATIALEMGEADQTTGSAHYHALFALGFFLLVFSFICNVISEWAVRRTKKKLKG